MVYICWATTHNITNRKKKQNKKKEIYRIQITVKYVRISSDKTNSTMRKGVMEREGRGARVRMWKYISKIHTYITYKLECQHWVFLLRNTNVPEKTTEELYTISTHHHGVSEWREQYEQKDDTHSEREKTKIRYIQKKGRHIILTSPIMLL